MANLYIYDSQQEEFMDTKSIENANDILDIKKENISLTIEGNLSERKLIMCLSGCALCK